MHPGDPPYGPVKTKEEEERVDKEKGMEGGKKKEKMARRSGEERRRVTGQRPAEEPLPRRPGRPSARPGTLPRGGGGGSRKRQGRKESEGALVGGPLSRGPFQGAAPRTSKSTSTGASPAPT